MSGAASLEQPQQQQQQQAAGRLGPGASDGGSLGNLAAAFSTGTASVGISRQPSLISAAAGAAAGSSNAAEAAAAAAAAAGRAAAAEIAADAAATTWQRAVRLAAYSCEAGLVELEQLVCWVEQQLVSAGGASEELREAALVLAAASCKVRAVACACPLLVRGYALYVRLLGWMLHNTGIFTMVSTPITMTYVAAAEGASEQVREAALLLAAASCKVLEGCFADPFLLRYSALHADTCCGCSGAGCF
jgi:hypothetical protein